MSGEVKLKQKDFLWIIALLLVTGILVYPVTHNMFIAATITHPYIMGFVKVSILASMGELLAIRIATGDWKTPAGVIYRFIVWGFIGMTFVLVFDLFANGISGSMNNGLLPSLAEKTYLSPYLFAFFTSTFMNLIFAPTFMAFHRITDTYIDLGQGKINKIVRVKLIDVIQTINWYDFISFVILKTIPFFWIPAHTITFMLPSEYRVLMAACLSIVLGGILAFAKRTSTQSGNH